jgi:hypothetical protein
MGANHLLKAVIWVKAVVWIRAVVAVINQFAITVTGVIGASARNLAAVVSKPTLAQLSHHPMATTTIVPKLRSHSHAILTLAPTAIKQPLQPIYLN